MLPLTDHIRPSGWSRVLIGVEKNTYRLFDLFDECHLKVAVQLRSHLRQHEVKMRWTQSGFERGMTI